MGRCHECGQESGRGVHHCRAITAAGPGDGAVTTARRSPATAAAFARTSSSDTPPPRTSYLSPGTMVGEYQIEHKLGEGGMGAVYGATHPVIRKRAAVKVIHAALSTNLEAIERFVQEARAINEIGHPNIVDVFAFGELPDGRRYFAMEWLQGESLADRIKRERLTVDETCLVLEQIADALAAAHEKGVIHRDLKPDNVFLVQSPGGRFSVKLLDFGIAKLNAGDPTRVERTRTGVMMGTPLYVSPEQARGKSVDARTDIYALGALAYELLTGKPPFDADNVSDIIAMHLTRPPPSPTTIPREVPRVLREAVTRMLAKDREERPTVAELQQVVAQVRRVRTGAGPAAEAPARGRRTAWIVAAPAALAVAAAIAWPLVRRGGEEAAPRDRAAPPARPIARPAPAPAPAPDPPAPAEAAAEEVVPEPPGPDVAEETRRPPRRRPARKKTDGQPASKPAVDEDHALANPWEEKSP